MTVLRGLRFGDPATVEIDGAWVRWTSRETALVPLRRDRAAELSELRVLAVEPQARRGITLGHLGTLGLGVVVACIPDARWFGVALAVAALAAIAYRWFRPPYVLVLSTYNELEQRELDFAMVLDHASLPAAHALAAAHGRAALPAAVVRPE